MSTPITTSLLAEVVEVAEAQSREAHPNDAAAATRYSNRLIAGFVRGYVAQSKVADGYAAFARASLGIAGAR